MVTRLLKKNTNIIILHFNCYYLFNSIKVKLLLTIQVETVKCFIFSFLMKYIMRIPTILEVAEYSQ